MRRLNSGFFHMVLSLDGRIDEERLARSARLAADAEPLLGCRFVEHWFRPFWERRCDLEDAEFLRLEEPAHMKVELNRFRTETCDPCWDLQFKVLVLRGTTDTICVRLNHMIGDAGAGKDLIYLLTSIYNRLGENPDYRPEPNLTSDRSYRTIGRQLKLKDKLAILGNLRWPLRELKRSGIRWQFPVPKDGREEGIFSSLFLPPERGEAISRYAKKHQASVNLVLLTSFFRALQAVVPHPPEVPLPLIMTVDLRRYLQSKHANAICNQAGAEILFARSGPDTEFNEVLAQFSEQFEVLKKSYLGLSSIPLILETFPLINVVNFVPFCLIKKAFNAKANPLSNANGVAALTNVGAVDPERSRFGDIEVSSAHWTWTLPRVPGGIGVVVTYFKKAITFTIHYSENRLPQSTVQAVLDRIDQELPH